MTLRKFAVLAFLALGLAGCNRHAALPNTPEGTLEKYVTAAFEINSLDDKKKLLELSTGDAKAHLEQVSDEDFKKQFIDSKLRLVSMKATDLREQPSGEVSLAYELNFQERANATAPVVHTNKKIAYLAKDEKGDWKIKSTKNIKTFIEAKEDLVISPNEKEPAENKAGDQK